MFNYRCRRQNYPQDIEQNYCWKSFDSRGPYQGNAGCDGKNIQPPELSSKQQARENYCNFCRETPSFNSIGFIPIPSRAHGFNRVHYVREKFFHLVRTAGFEPATPCSQSRCATKLRYVRVTREYLFYVIKIPVII